MEPEFDPSIFKNAVFRVASRSSNLAMAQTNEVIAMLTSHPKLGLSASNFTIVPVSSSEGDQNLQDPLYLMGGTGVFTKNVERELKLNNADIAVHSLKDLPTIIDEALVIAAVPRLMPRNDVVISNGEVKSLADLKKESVIGTSSLRRIAGLTHRYPFLAFKNIRGNLNTRIRKLDQGEYDAIILARAGVQRLGLEDRIKAELDEKEYLYAPGQGALGVQCRKGDELSGRLLSFLEDTEARRRTDAERQFLNKLEGGCKLPIGVYSEIKEGRLTLVGQVWDLEGKKTVREAIEGAEGESDLGSRLALLMKEKGADVILSEIKGSEKVIPKKT